MMSPKTTIKPSSRAGRFKKKLVSPAVLLIEAPQVEATVAPFLDLYHSNELTQAELTALYVIVVLSVRYPGNWLGSKRPPIEITHRLNLPLPLGLFEPNIQRRLVGLCLGDVFTNFALKSTPEAVNRSLLAWSVGSYDLELMFRIPTPLEVLKQQRIGRRCVTLLTRAEQTSHYILGDRDALGFTMHDLIHADHFYHDNACYEGQLGFYGLLHKCLCAGHFRDLTDEKFLYEFEYLISDMNAYAIHSMKCFKAALVHYASQDFFKGWLLKLPLETHIHEALLELNTSAYYPEKKDSIILEWLKTYRS